MDVKQLEGQLEVLNMRLKRLDEQRSSILSDIFDTHRQIHEEIYRSRDSVIWE